jgi:ABC-type sugar transport system substrate-binding protein
VRRALLFAALSVTAAGCGGSGASAPSGQTPQLQTLTIAVVAPFSRDAYLGTTIANGARLGGGRLTFPVGRNYFRFKFVQYDSAGSPSQAVAAVRRALAAKAVAIVTDGAGVDARTSSGSRRRTTGSRSAWPSISFPKG